MRRWREGRKDRGKEGSEDRCGREVEGIKEG